MTCETCGEPLAIGEWPFCPHGETGTFNVQADGIPGGLTLHNLGHEPVTVYSHSERRRIMAERGLREQVRHVGIPGSDRSPHTTRWI